MTDRLIAELTVASKFISPRTTLPVLVNVLIETDDGGLYLSTTNLDQRLRVFVPAMVKGQGSTTVNIKTLLRKSWLSIRHSALTASGRQSIPTSSRMADDERTTNSGRTSA